MLVILKPTAFRARTADSRPGPGPLMRTSRFLTPHSCAALPAASAATCAANGVDLREPLKPAPPDVAHDSALPWRSVMVMIVLLNDAWMCAMPSDTLFFTFLRVRVPLVLVGACAIRYVLNACSVRLVCLCLALFGFWRRLRRRRLARLARALAGARVGARALPADRQPLAVAHATVA